MNIGKIKQIIGVVVDVEFNDQIPAIYNALTIKHNDTLLTLEVEQHLDESTVRSVSMGVTDGLKKGMDVAQLQGLIMCHYA